MWIVLDDWSLVNLDRVERIITNSPTTLAIWYGHGVTDEDPGIERIEVGDPTKVLQTIAASLAQGVRLLDLEPYQKGGPNGSSGS